MGRPPDKKNSLKAVARLQRIGNANQIASIEVIMDFFGITRPAAFQTLRALKIPLLYFGSNAFFNLYSFEKAIFYLSRQGARGFCAPGSQYKSKDRYKKKQLGNPFLELTDKDIEIMNSPTFLAEFMASGRNKTSSSSAAYIAAVQKTPSDLIREIK